MPTTQIYKMCTKANAIWLTPQYADLWIPRWWAWKIILNLLVKRPSWFGRKDNYWNMIQKSRGACKPSKWVNTSSEELRMKDPFARGTVINHKVTENVLNPRCQFSLSSQQGTLGTERGKGVRLKHPYLLLSQQGLLLHDFHGIDVPSCSLAYHPHFGKVTTTYKTSDFKVLCWRLEPL